MTYIHGEIDEIIKQISERFRKEHVKILDAYCEAHLCEYYKRGETADIRDFTLVTKHVIRGENDSCIQYWLEPTPKGNNMKDLHGEIANEEFYQNKITDPTEIAVKEGLLNLLGRKVPSAKLRRLMDAYCAFMDAVAIE